MKTELNRINGRELPWVCFAQQKHGGGDVNDSKVFLLGVEKPWFLSYLWLNVSDHQ